MVWNRSARGWVVLRARRCRSRLPDRADKPLEMPAPHGQSGLWNATLDVGSDGLVGPVEHRFIVNKNATQAADGRRIGQRVRIINVMAVGRRQRSPDHLMKPHQQLAT